MLLSAQCPTCGRAYQIDASKAGTKAICVGCKATFTLTASAGATQQPAKSSKPPPPGKSPPISKPTATQNPHAASSIAPAATGTVYPSISGPTEVLPRRLGRFELRKRVGAGSFGAVYLAYDTTLKREVALKLPHPVALMMSGTAERFLREAQTSAQLRHPNIVPMFDAGDEQGQLYIASAFIHGHTLEAELKQRRPDATTAAKLVMKLAEALAYAHRLGVIHRDVKPANIMLDAQGEPFLMDFGIARWEHADQKLTQDAGALGTPLYMSPEQAGLQGTTIGPGCDQYSLGVVLYELLCGRTPFLGDTALAMLLMKIRDEEPPPPRTLKPSLPRDLETICRKALSKRPEHRYRDDTGKPSCQTLADDLRRYVDGEPIKARRVGPIERMVRWTRRNPVTAGLTLATVGLLIIVALVSSFSAARMAILRNQEAAARKEAEKSRDREAEARETADRRTAEAETARSKEAEARTLADTRKVESELHRKQAELNAAQATASAEKEAEARALAESNAKLADEQRNIALDTLSSLVFDVQRQLEGTPALQDLKRRILESAIDKLIAIGLTMKGSDDRPDRLIAAAQSKVSYILMTLGSIDEAAKLAESACKTFRLLALANPMEWQAQYELCSSLLALGVLRVQQGNIGEARKLYDDGLMLAKRSAEANPTSSAVQIQIASCCTRLGNLSLSQRDATEAQRYYEDALAIHKQMAELTPNSVEAQLLLARSYDSLGSANVPQGKLDAARQFYDESLAIRKLLAEAHPENADLQRELAQGYNDRGYLAREQGELTESKLFYERGLAIRMRLAEDDPANAFAQHDVFESHLRIGVVAKRDKRYGDALAAFRAGEAILLKMIERGMAVESSRRELEYLQKEEIAETEAKAGIPKPAIRNRP